MASVRESQAQQAARPLGAGVPSIENLVRTAYYTPSPVAYDPKKPEVGGGKISEARLPSTNEHFGRQAAFVPGPGTYETPELGDFACPEGGRLNRKPPREVYRLDEYPVPPPGTYGENGVPHDPTVPRQLYGSFGKDPRITKFIHEEVQRSKGVPAPGAHEVMESRENMRPFCPEGGRYLDQMGRQGNGYFDHAAKMSEAGPDPGHYKLPGAIKPNKAAGKLVWKYQSETLAKTKKTIIKVNGDPNVGPAPGHYTLPDSKPLSEAPAIKGKEVGHGMPHPYAYNCAPDHARKFDSYVPVREQNSSDSIYGRPLSREQRAGTANRVKRAAATADEVAAQQLPITMAERGIEQPHELPQWKSGGFSQMRKVKSTPALQQQNSDHPGLGETRAHYPSLSKFHGRHDKTFLPNASRRPEIVKTGNKSSEYATLMRKKWELGNIYSELLNVGMATLETLDEQKLRDEATLGLMDKAKFRMRMEGLAEDQQDLVLGELPGVLAEAGSPTRSREHSGYTSLVGSVRGERGLMMDEPFAEPPAFVSAY